ncbi:RluA family pseudouridine synthase [Pseudaestuariivita atlantica]|uniref:Pseudouridine synthase n=1 Tax=Pseudaestuariivita atlantica TaxID=1317121 RepID=A0A0L1JU66_9RHOB|nr:RluA family pseudouridine synthase [Pseudaestuariivita atlantica]KNG95324.1 pseudouridine synthase [Pseudaestuariivita atlantica]
MSSSVTEVSFCIAADPPPRLDKALARDVPEEAALSRSRLARLIAEGAVRVGGSVVTDPRAKVAEGAEVVIAVPQAVETDMVAEDIPLDIVHEDAALIVVNKPAGMVVHPAPGTPGGTLVNALLHHFGGDLSGVGGVQRPGIVHRIDKDTSGLLVVAKSDAAHHGLAEQFSAHTAHRVYRAVCHGVPDVGDPRLVGTRGVSVEPGGVIKITSGLERHRTDRQKQAVVFGGGGRHAVTRVRVLERFDGAALIACQLETGRTHQIRAHMAHVGHGLVGDPVYGGRRKLRAGAGAFDRQALHAAELGFVHPVTGESLRFSAPDPTDMALLIARLRTEV